MSDIVFEVVDPESDDAIGAVTQYFAELAERFVGGFDAGDALIAEMPAYRLPDGLFVVARRDTDVVACGGLHRIDAATCEIKRMWVHASQRGAGIGRRLLGHLEQRCRDLGSSRVVLDTNSVLTQAIAMYESGGYRAIERYNDNPYAAYWFEKTLV